MEPDELFQGLEIEEPSSAADERILALACGRLRARRRRRLGLGALVAGSLAALFAFLVFPPHGILAPGGGETNIAEAASREDIEALREDLVQIQEMAELIPYEMDCDQQSIEQRVRECLEDLERLERVLEKFDERLSPPMTTRKGVSI